MVDMSQLSLLFYYNRSFRIKALKLNKLSPSPASANYSIISYVALHMILNSAWYQNFFIYKTRLTDKFTLCGYFKNEKYLELC